MNKQELVKKLAEDTSLSQKDAKIVIESLIEIIVSHVAVGEDVDIMGFGKFTSAETAARKGRNPSTGEEVDIDAKVKPKFKPGKTFRERVAKGE